MGNTKSFEERYQEELAAAEAANGAPNQETPTAETVETQAAETVETTETAETEVGETEKKAEEKAPEKSWAEIKAEFEKSEAERLEREELENLKNDDFIKEYRKAKAQGIDMKTFVNSIADVDVSMISDETLFKNSLSGQKMSESELDDAWQEFKEQKDYIKNTYLETERNKISAQVEEKRKAFKGTQIISDPNAVYSEAKSGLDNFLEKTVNTKVDGIFMTPKMALDVAKLAPKFFASSMKDGKVDVSEAFDTAFAKLAKTQWRDELIKQGETKGLETAFQEKHNPNATSMVNGKKAKEMTKEEKEEAEVLARLKSKPQSFLSDK